MKRFTETEKWRDNWFQALSPDAKLAFIYMTENCDAAGIWDPNERLAEFSMGKKIGWEKVYEELKSKILRMGNGKIFLTRFIDFQYGNLTEACKPHLKVLRTLQYHGIRYPIDTLSIPLAKGSLTLEDKDKEEDKDIIGGAGESLLIPELASKQFTQPSPDEVTAYAQEIGYQMDGAAWCDSYAQKGWKVGKNKMKDWQAAVRTWKANKWLPSKGGSTTSLEPRFNQW